LIKPKQLAYVKKILLVDDDKEDQIIINDAFIEVGGEGLVHYEGNGEKAMKYLERSFAEGNLPSLVILDLNMPRMNGTQTLRAIKSDSRFRNLLVMIYSTSLNPIEKEECMLLGAEDYVIKPIAYDESLQIARYFKECCEKMAAL
jgi:CheY-like chemotaxis protein